MQRSIFALVAGVGFFSASPVVAVPESRPTQTVDRGTQVRAPQELREKYRRMAERSRPPKVVDARLVPGNEKPMSVQGRLQSFDDGVALIAMPIRSVQKSVLLRLGAIEVQRAREVRHHSIFNDHYYREVPVAPQAAAACTDCARDRLAGPDPHRLARRVGENIVLELRRDREGHSWVVRIIQ